MGINREFKYGIKLYTFSFAFSNLKLQNDLKHKENLHSKEGYRFLSTFTREIYNTTKKIKNKAKQKAWVFNTF